MRPRPSYPQTCAIHAPGVQCDGPSCPGYLNAASPGVGAETVDDMAAAELPDPDSEVETLARDEVAAEFADAEPESGAV